MTLKNCTQCHKTKPLDDFGKHKRRHDGVRAQCKECVNKINKRYRETVRGVVHTIYNSMRHHSVDRGHQPPNFSRKELYSWMMKQPLFPILFERWKSSGYLSSLKPSCDRTDDSKGYDLSRLNLVIWYENDEKGRLCKKGHT